MRATMIKEISEEFNRKNRENVLILLEQIKDLRYKVYSKNTSTIKKIVHYSQDYFGGDIVIMITFSPNTKKIEQIDITSQFYSSYNMIFKDNILTINTGLNLKEITAISEELYNKYFGDNNANNNK